MTDSVIPEASHDELWKVASVRETDYEPYGNMPRDSDDCSCGCMWFHVLEGRRGNDWGVCFNPKGPRRGLLTFEHMGCPQFRLIDE
ncbi:hypothetical protein LCGC14_3131500 [marine sediment metagenome]|uniref:Uncharacterized protein n=1 Tax=marine sediment metagenome TaxID=412755 RepID=A0A0F8WNC2_9ZZZZ